jgi:hypothetical protein
VSLLRRVTEPEDPESQSSPSPQLVLQRGRAGTKTRQGRRGASDAQSWSNACESLPNTQPRKGVRHTAVRIPQGAVPLGELRLVGPNTGCSGRTVKNVPSTKGREIGGFCRLRQRARDGDFHALIGLRKHVQRRLRAGWHPATVARRLGVTLEEILIWGGNAYRKPEDLKPRLVRRP